jgi:hypothetical protein
MLTEDESSTRWLALAALMAEDHANGVMEESPRSSEESATRSRSMLSCILSNASFGLRWSGVEFETT